MPIANHMRGARHRSTSQQRQTGAGDDRGQPIAATGQHQQRRRPAAAAGSTTATAPAGRRPRWPRPCRRGSRATRGQTWPSTAAVAAVAMRGHAQRLAQHRRNAQSRSGVASMPLPMSNAPRPANSSPWCGRHCCRRCRCCVCGMSMGNAPAAGCRRRSRAGRRTATAMWSGDAKDTFDRRCVRAGCSPTPGVSGLRHAPTAGSDFTKRLTTGRRSRKAANRRSPSAGALYDDQSSAQRRRRACRCNGHERSALPARGEPSFARRSYRQPAVGLRSRRKSAARAAVCHRRFRQRITRRTAAAPSCGMSRAPSPVVRSTSVSSRATSSGHRSPRRSRLVTGVFRLGAPTSRPGRQWWHGWHRTPAPVCWKPARPPVWPALAGQLGQRPRQAHGYGHAPAGRPAVHAANRLAEIAAASAAGWSAGSIRAVPPR